MENSLRFFHLPRLILMGFSCVVGLTGCYELPPVIPRGYVGSLPAPGWPPLCVYDSDPFSRSNRWFHRQFSDRSSDGEILRARADEPFGLMVNPSAVDEAEVLAILRALVAEPPIKPNPGELRACLSYSIFCSDLFQESCRIGVEWPVSRRREDIICLLRHFAGFSGPTARDWKSEVFVAPPPLRQGEWQEMQAPMAPGLAASVVDPRGSRLFFRESPRRESLLVRCRVLPREGEGLEALPIANECWQIVEDEDGFAYNVLRFDRAEWLQGRDPWHAIAQDSEIVIRDPTDPTRRLVGSPKRLCIACHCGS